MRKVLVLIAALSAAPGAAATWVEIVKTSTGGVASIDKDSVKVEGDAVLGWVSWDYSNDKTEKARTAKTRVSIKCGAETFKSVYYAQYDADGAIIDSGNLPSYTQYSPIIPDSVGDTIFKSICSIAGQ